MGLYLVGRHGELQALGWALGEGARDGGRQGAGHASHVQPLTLSLPAGRCARLLKEVSLRPQLSPGLTGVPAHSRSRGLQGADARLPRGGPGGWGGQGRVTQVSIRWGTQALWTPSRAPGSPTVLTLQLSTAPLPQ